jgi:drug/metabolite transporter (DMT)-like permease
VIVAGLLALGGAFFFALAAVLQQREAAQVHHSTGASDPRLLWRLAQRPWWLAGIAADLASAALHVWALAKGSIALVQPLGVTGLLWAIPMVALLRRTRVHARDVGAAVIVLAGLALFLSVIPHQGGPDPETANSAVWVLAGTVAVLLGVMALTHSRSPRTRSILLAGGAGIAFGVVAALARTILVVAGHGHPLAIVAAGVGIALLLGVGYLMLQQAYRAGYFAASLATAVVADPPAAIVAGFLALHEPLPHGPLPLVAVAVAAAMVVTGIALLVRSPAHVLTLSEEDPAPEPNPAGHDA